MKCKKYLKVWRSIIMVSNYLSTKLDREREIRNRYYVNKTPETTVMAYLKKKNKELEEELKHLREVNSQLIEQVSCLTTELDQYKKGMNNND